MYPFINTRRSYHYKNMLLITQKCFISAQIESISVFFVCVLPGYPFHKARLVCAPCGFIQQVGEFVGITFPLKCFCCGLQKGQSQAFPSSAWLQHVFKRHNLIFYLDFSAIRIRLSACLLSMYMLRAFLSWGLAAVVRYSCQLVFCTSALAKADEGSAEWRTNTAVCNLYPLRASIMRAVRRPWVWTHTFLRGQSWGWRSRQEDFSSDSLKIHCKWGRKGM